MVLVPVLQLQEIILLYWELKGELVFWSAPGPRLQLCKISIWCLLTCCVFGRVGDRRVGGTLDVKFLSSSLSYIGAGVTPKLTNCLQKSSFIGWWNMFRKLKHGELYYGTFQKNQLKVMGTKNLSTNLTKPTVASSPLDAETLVTRSYHSFLTLAAAIGSNSLKSLLVSKISGSFLKQATAIPSCRH